MKFRYKPLITIFFFSGAPGQKIKRNLIKCSNFSSSSAHRKVSTKPQKDSNIKYLKTGETRTLFLHCGNNLRRRHLASIFGKQHRTPEKKHFKLSTMFWKQTALCHDLSRVHMHLTAGSRHIQSSPSQHCRVMIFKIRGRSFSCKEK